MTLSVQDEAFVRTQIQFNKNSYQGSPVNSVVAQPIQDTFEKSEIQNENTKEVCKDSKTLDSLKTVIPHVNPSFKSKWLTRENIIIGGTGIVLTAVVAAIGIFSRRNLAKTLSSVQGALTDAQDKLKTQAEQIIENQKLIASLTELPSDLKEAKAIAIKKYQTMLQNATLSYDPLKAPIKPLEENIYISCANKVFNIENIKPFKASEIVGNITDTVKLKEALNKKGVVELSIPMSSKVKPVISKNASISGTDIPDLGKTVNSDFKLNYGKRISWSEEKIARDIMQNFYDGHGNTLDGVKLAVKKRPDGQYNVKVSVLAKFDYENLQYMGSGSKLENPYNAGGFGEGAKVLVATMLGKGDAQHVKYSCSDWELTFDAAKGIIRRTLKKVQIPIDGNEIEFTTGNKKLADAILDSVNYFEHSGNPDFKGLQFDSKDFGFRFAGQNEKGNIYLTQRFEYEKAGNWNNGVDNLTLIFKRKPDADEFKKITGVPMPKDRDRQFLTYEDVKNYTKYFAHNMSNEDLVKALITTRPKWEHINTSKRTAIQGFLEGLVNEMYQRHMAINFDAEKLVAKDNSVMSEAVRSSLFEYGYKICPEFFYKVGMSEAEKVFDSFSVHKALQPTVAEIKKLKLLEEGVNLIENDIKTAFMKFKETPTVNLTKKFYDDVMADSYQLMRLDEIEDIKKILKKYHISGFDYNSKKISITDYEKMKTEIETTIKNILKGNPDEKIIKLIQRMKDIGYFDEMTSQYLLTYKNLNLIEHADVSKPRYIFSRTNEIAQNTLGESITNNGVYLGHWIDREYLNNADYNQLLGTWIHEICHKVGGDGTPEFTYALTDMLRVILRAEVSHSAKIKLSALEDVFSKIQ